MRRRWGGWGEGVNEIKASKTANEAYASSVGDDSAFSSANIAFVCLHLDCGALSNHHWSLADSLTVWLGGHEISNRKMSEKTSVVAARCEACQRETIFVNGIVAYPGLSEAPTPHRDMPPEIRDDYVEAASILRYSLRGSAALLRLAVQKLLPLIGATQKDINAQIGELVAKGTLTAVVQKALDSVRVIGNEAVHPGTMDLSDDIATATSLFKLLNLIVEKSISEPKMVDEIFAGLPEAKLKGIEVRDSKFAGS